jgi:hypothetical protein
MHVGRDSARGMHIDGVAVRLERAVYTAAMLPAAPTLFSTMMVRLANGRTFSPKYRTSTSAPLPAGKPQMKRISWLG